MDNKKFVQALGFAPKNNTVGVYEKVYKQHDYSIEIDFSKERICYGDLIGADCKTTQNFSQAENWVVLECVDRLLEKGYKPQNIILEKTWAAGHGTSGRLDICVTRDDGSEYLLIECKTYGKEFDKAVTKLNKDGGQLFTYFKFSNKADVIMLYTSELQGKELVYKNEIVKIEEEYKVGDVKDFYEKWNKLTKDNGIFENWVKPYCFESKALVKSQLKPINQEDSSFIFNRFLEILRHNVVSDKGNAFNKIFTLFLCKVYDETSKQDDEELDFQWKEGVDTDVSFQLRLTDLYKNGMEVFLSRIVSDFDEQEFENKYKHLSKETKDELLKEINTLRLEKNNEFAIKEVYDHDSFVENAKIVKEVVELLQGYRIRYNKRQQYLSDFFELLLTTGLKQEAGQFFTPVPIAQFIIKSLPLEKIVDEKLKQKNGELLPYMIDYAAGSGHFITEYMHEVQAMIDNKLPNKYIETTSKKIKNWQSDPYDWATDYVYGIEKDYRLVKVGKVGCYLHGDGLANVILSDGLGNFVNTKDYKGKLHKQNDDNSKDNQQFDILLSNPPYSVSAFRQTTRDYYTEKDFDLYGKLTDNSSEIECLFVERTKQLLKDGGVAGVILPSSILTNSGIYTKTRELLLKYFEIVGITELGSNTFMATGTNTVVLFLRRRNNYECTNLEKSVDKFFSNHTDVTINSIETPVAKYVNYVWEGLSFDDYLTLLDQKPNDKVKNHDLFKEYSNKIKSDKDFWNNVIELEKEKIYYFILCYSQKLVIVKTGEKDAEKQFLGYEFSNRRGSEGIHAIQRNKSIDECTKLFDINTFDNPKKASTYIHKAFENDLDFAIDETLKDNVSRVCLLDMMTFDRADFEKVINTKAKKKIKIESKYQIAKLSNICDLQSGYAFSSDDYVKKSNTLNIRMSNIRPNGEFNALYNECFLPDAYADRYSEFLLNDGDVIVAMTDMAREMKILGMPTFVVKTDKNIKYLMNQRVCRFFNINEKVITKKYLSIILQLPEIREFYRQVGKGSVQINLSKGDILNQKIPLPPLDIQQKIVDEIEKIEKQNNTVQKQILENKQEKQNYISSTILSAKTNIVSLESIVDFKRGPFGGSLKKEIFVDKGYKVYEQKHAINNDFSIGNYYITPEKFEEMKGFELLPNDIIMSCSGTIGRFAVFPNDAEKGIINQALLRLRKSSDNVSDEYLLQCLKAISTKFEENSHGAGLKNVASVSVLKEIKVYCPSLTEQQKIVSQIEELEKRIAKAQWVIDNSKQQKQAILDKYLK